MCDGIRARYAYSKAKEFTWFTDINQIFAGDITAVLYYHYGPKKPDVLACELPQELPNEFTISVQFKHYLIEGGTGETPLRWRFKRSINGEDKLHGDIQGFQERMIISDI